MPFISDKNKMKCKLRCAPPLEFRRAMNLTLGGSMGQAASEKAYMHPFRGSEFFMLETYQWDCDVLCSCGDGVDYIARNVTVANTESLMHA